MVTKKKSDGKFKDGEFINIDSANHTVVLDDDNDDDE